MDLHDRLTAHLKAEMARTPQPKLGAVMDRGHELKRRRRLLAVAMPAAAVVLVTAGVLALRPEAGGNRLAEADQVAAANAALSIGTATFDWDASPADLGWAMQQATGDGVMYALSTAPGVRWEQFPNGNLPEAIYASADGVNWTGHPVSSTWINSISAADGLLYAVGTAPGAEADSVTLQVGVSSDMGANFATTALPFERNGPGFTDTRVLANPVGVLALASHTVTTDPWSLLPPEELERGEPLVLEDGMAVFPFEALGDAEAACYSGDPAECDAFVESRATFAATWEELGLDEEARFGEQITRTAYVSADGSNYEEIEYPLPEGWIERSTNLGDTTVAIVSGPTGSSLVGSNDLRTWRPIAENVRSNWLLDVGMVGDEYVLVGVGGEGDRPVVYRSDDLFGSWTEVPVGDLLPRVDNQESFLWVNSAAVGSGGVAISIGGEFGSSGGSGGNPVIDLIDRVLPGSAGERDEGNFAQMSMLLVSQDLAEWNVATSQEMGGMVESIQFSPQGDLIATVTGVENGQPQRWAAKATIDP